MPLLGSGPENWGYAIGYFEQKHYKLCALVARERRKEGNMKKLVLAAAFAAIAAAPAFAQTYPNKAITMIVPFAAGGPTDIVARIVAEPMSRALGQSVVIENVGGAGGTTGITRGAGAAPDGYTLMMGHMGTHGAAPALYPNLKYDPTKDFSPIGMAAGTPIIIVGKKGHPANNLKEFIEWAKKQGDKANQAHAGVGSVSHSTGILLNSIMGTKSTFIPYTGTGPALNDMMSGQVDYMTDQIVNLVGQINAGTVKAFAIATSTRSPALPNLPTTKEAGLDGYEVSAWNAVFAPKGTPVDVVAKLEAALNTALDDAGAKKRLADLGAVSPVGADRGSAALQKLVNSEVARWTPVLKAAMAATK
jgi:tripartite-type tricarboxylate transporter receptor subunit TctC